MSVYIFLLSPDHLTKDCNVSTWEAFIAKRIQVDPLQSRVVGEDHIRHSHLILISDDYRPVPVHDTLWRLFFNNKLLNNHLPATDEYYKKYPHSGDSSLQLPVVDLRKTADVSVIFEPFLHYMYTGDRGAQYVRWLAPRAEVGENKDNLSKTRQRELYTKNLDLTTLFYQRAEDWGVKDEMYLQALSDFCTVPEDRLRVCASVLICGVIDIYFSKRLG